MKRHLLILALTLSIIIGGSQMILPPQANALERGAGVTADVLPDTLQTTVIEKAFIASEDRRVGSIQTLTGSVIVVHGGITGAYFALPGDRIYEKDRIFTLDDTRCRLKFIDENVITMGSNAEIGVEEVVADLERGEKQSLFSMAQGKVMFYALKMFRYSKATMTVQTKTAVVGVRGTKFGIEVTEEERKNLASRPVYLADASETGWIRFVQNETNGPTTTVYGFDGQVSVTSTVDRQTQTVAPGQMLSTTTRGSGQVQRTPPGVARQFESDTEAPPPPQDDTGGESGTDDTAGGTNDEQQGDDQDDGTDDNQDDGTGNDQDGGTAQDDTGDAGASGSGTTTDDITSATINTTDITQQQTAQTVETQEDPVQDPGTNATGDSVGYLSAMLTNASQGSLEEIFVSQTRQDFDSDSSVWARGHKNTDTDYIRGGDEQGAMGDPYAKWAVFNSGSKNTGSLGNNYPITHHQLGSYENSGQTWLEWGDWRLSNTIVVDGISYQINHKAHYIHGVNTPSSEIALLSGSATYTGGAEGTYWTAGGGVGMSGSFSCIINFDTDTISELSINVEDTSNAYNASIFIPHPVTIPLKSDGTFSITEGTWELKGTTPDVKMANGSLYGGDSAAVDTAKGIGGAWGMYKTNGEGATGIFHGQR